MRSIFLTSIAALAFASGPALAADFALKAPVYAPAYSWQGCYAGFNGGGVWNSTSYNIGNNNPAYFGPAFASGATPSYYSENVSSGILGGQAGCNLQSGSFVYGLEGDAEWVNHTSSDAINTNVLAFGPATGTVTQKLELISTIRARVGYAFDHLLLYGTGGIALGNTNDYYRFAFPQRQPALCQHLFEHAKRLGGRRRRRVRVWLQLERQARRALVSPRRQCFPGR